MPQVTEKQIEKYIEKRGVHCPKCESQNIEGDSFDVDENGANQQMACIDCDFEWFDIYKLVGIEEL